MEVWGERGDELNRLLSVFPEKEEETRQLFGHQLRPLTKQGSA